LDKKTVLEILSRFRKSLESQGIKIDKIILFGSFSTGNYHEGSDIDAVVISDDFKDKSYWERIDILSNSIYEIFEPIEAIAMTPDEWNNKENMVSVFAENGEVISV
jgi:uncharacterized protein